MGTCTAETHEDPTYTKAQDQRGSQRDPNGYARERRPSMSKLALNIQRIVIG